MALLFSRQTPPSAGRQCRVFADIQGQAHCLACDNWLQETATHLATEPLLQVQTALHDLLIICALLAAWQGKLLCGLHSSVDALPYARGLLQGLRQVSSRSPKLCCSIARLQAELLH